MGSSERPDDDRPADESAAESRPTRKPNIVMRFDPNSGARLRWERPLRDPLLSPFAEEELTSEQCAVLRTLSARYVWWLPSSDAARHASRVLAQAMDLGDAADEGILLANFPVPLLGRALKYGLSRGWFPFEGDKRWRDRLAGDDGPAAA